MPLQAGRVLRQFRYAMYFNGIDGYVVIPLTVYGWSAITIQEWIYPYYPKANTLYSIFNQIGIHSSPDLAHTSLTTDNRVDYTYLNAVWNTRKPDGTATSFVFSLYAYRNSWVNIVRRFDSAREFAGFINASKVYSATVPSDYVTVLEQNPSTASCPDCYKRFVLGASTRLSNFINMMQYQLLIYKDKALSDSEVEWNYKYPDNPIRDNLFVWLRADPNNIRDIDGDGVLEWIDLSGYNNHGKIYGGAFLVQLVKSAIRILPKARILKVLR